MHIVEWVVLGGIVVFVAMMVSLVAYMRMSYKSIMKKTDTESAYLLGLIKEKDKQFISFEESFLSTKVPTIQFEIYGKMFRFLLDTGADANYMDKSIIIHLRSDHKECKITKGKPFYTASGTMEESFSCKLPFKYRNTTFKENFNIADLSSAFNKLEDSKGVKVSGILGSDFFEKYRWQLDFDKLVVWANLTPDS